MNIRPMSRVIAAALIVASAPVLACGEGQFNTGQGLRYQGYLAPKPATVLVVSVAGERSKVYRGLELAGHRVTRVADRPALEAAMASRKFDIVIADFGSDSFAVVQDWRARGSATSSTTQVLPVLARREPNAAAIRAQFGQVLTEGASLGQYLKAINQAVASR